MLAGLWRTDFAFTSSKQGHCRSVPREERKRRGGNLASEDLKHVNLLTTSKRPDFEQRKFAKVSAEIIRQQD